MPIHHRSTRLKQIKKAMQKAATYDQWLEYAHELDHLEGKDIWREQDDTADLHFGLIRRQLIRMRELRSAGRVEALVDLMQESLYRNLAEISNPELYGYALTGTKKLITAYLDEIETTMHYVCDSDVPGVSQREKYERFKLAERIFGRPALMLSGGGSFGIYHIGVVKALYEQELLPGIVSGSSMGAIVAAGICSRDDVKLADFFAHPEQIYRKALKMRDAREFWRHKTLMDPDQLLRHIRINVGDCTFKEAFETSGRVLNITVSPTRIRQKPRLLNHITTPDVMVAHSALASCAVPGFFPPVTLRRKTASHRQVPYMPTETWIDGSVHSDLPLMRISRINNVNYTIVSQANPHVLPFITHQRRKGKMPFLKHLAASMIHAHATEILEISRDMSANAPWRPLLDKAYAMARQTYLGDINIRFPFTPHLYRKVASDPSLDDLKMYIRIGERATWPYIVFIRDQTRISRTFWRILKKLKKMGF